MHTKINTGYSMKSKKFQSVKNQYKYKDRSFVFEIMIRKKYLIVLRKFIGKSSGKIVEKIIAPQEVIDLNEEILNGK